MSAPVRRFGVWVLLLVYIMGATPVRELFKLPVLIAHYQEHSRSNPGTNPIGFIVLHYFSGIKHDADYERDMQLPFKASDSAPLVPAIEQPAAELFLLTPAPVPTCRKCLPLVALLLPPTPYLAMPSEPPEG